MKDSYRSPAPSHTVCLRLGRQVDYDQAWQWQKETVERLKRDPTAQETLFLVEHTPVITMGRTGESRHILQSPEDLAARGIAFRETRRGGSVTYHGPGQWTMYPILRLDARGRDLHRYLRQLEDVAIRFLARHGIAGFRLAGRSGVWVKNGTKPAKIAAVGIAVSNWISYHGMAINIASDLEIFRQAMIPCGISPEEGTVTSLAEMGCACDMNSSAAELISAFAEVFEVKCEAPPRLPPWLRKRLPLDGCAVAVKGHLHDLRLDTVCRQARCPNQAECFAKGRATFLLLGPWCTRQCGFCSVQRKQAQHAMPPPDPDEPRRVAEAARRLLLQHVVITSVTRDDLPDGGASHFAATIAAVRQTCPRATVEILVPDFNGNTAAWATAVNACPDVFNHNIETVPRLYAVVRPQADYRRSLELLAFAKRRRPQMMTKSGLMVGLGERQDEILDAGRDLRSAGVDMLTIGQYLQPTPGNLPVARFVPPEELDALAAALRQMGFAFVAAAPFVRSSYNAAEAWVEAKKEAGQTA